MTAETLDTLIESARAAERAGNWQEALLHYEAAFARLSVEGDPERAAELLRWIGTVHRERGDLEAATELYQSSLAVADAAGVLEHVGSALNCLGIVEQKLGRLEQADALYTRALELAEQAADFRVSAMIRQNLATLADIRGEVEGALRHYRAARESFRQLEDDLAAAWVLNNMGMGYIELADWAKAEECFAEAFRLADGMQDARTLGNIELNRAALFLKQRDFLRAREHCDQAYEIFTHLQSDVGLAEASRFYGVLFRDTSKPGLAETHFQRAVELAKAGRDLLLEAETLSEWALIHWEHGRSREALQCLNRAHWIFNDLGARRQLLDLERRLTQIEAIYLQIVQSWGESIESKDLYTAGHCRRVADYTCMLASAVGVTGRDLVWLRMGGYLHDVGKIAVPGEVLNKPGKLTPEEWAVMQSHTVEGDAIVAELNFPWDIRPIVRSHHERWDGSGYPDGLREEEIPLFARMLCVADVYDALTTTRSYRPALSREDALRIMESDRGRIFDPKLLDVFRELVVSGTVDALPEVAA